MVYIYESKNFVSDKLLSSIYHLYHGPFVKIKVKPDTDYTVSLLYNESSYFVTAFESKFIEGQTQTVKIVKIDGVISAQSSTAFL